jgi:GNAT superfamily N-acetyltransferase
MNDAAQVTIEPAGRQDVGVILEMIDALAEHLGLSHEMVASEADLYAALFGPVPKAEVVIARVGGEPAGFALYYDIYSTFRGRCGLHLEDLYVRPEWRGSGIGRLLVSHLARLTLERDCGRLEWWVLANDPKAMAFYESMGASAKDEWTVYRLKGEALRRMAARGAER